MTPIVSKNCRVRYPEHFSIGPFSIVDDFCYFAVRVRVGVGSHIASGCNFGGGSKHLFTLGDYCGISAGSTILCASSDFVNGLVTIPPPGCDAKGRSVEGDVVFENYTGIGSNSLVMPDNVVPEGTVIGALSFVPSRYRFKPWGVYAGNPLRLIKQRNKEAVMRQVEEYRKVTG